MIHKSWDQMKFLQFQFKIKMNWSVDNILFFNTLKLNSFICFQFITFPYNCGLKIFKFVDLNAIKE